MQNIFRTRSEPADHRAEAPVTPAQRLFDGKTTVPAISGAWQRERTVRSRLRATVLFRGKVASDFNVLRRI
jgi:hypothetical protein